jgi:hypothetical protein
MSNDRIKSTWNIVKMLTGRKSHYEILPTLNTSDKAYTNSKSISESFNRYLLSVADTIINNISNNCDQIDKSKTSSEYLSHIFKVTFPTINIVQLQLMKL